MRALHRLLLRHYRLELNDLLWMTIHFLPYFNNLINYLIANFTSYISLSARLSPFSDKITLNKLRTKLQDLLKIKSSYGSYAFVYRIHFLGIALMFYYIDQTFISSRGKKYNTAKSMSNLQYKNMKDSRPARTTTALFVKSKYFSEFNLFRERYIDREEASIRFIHYMT
ncbi:hypothetical protein Bhyg_10471 [Pseudolycoriella hygida]|uniref:Uncharacterized protein n=1 Tax=Pseudolycoriella hygida TaxID=35572 RepID=A0A9Q0RXE3_9DIPT|nr:hypothetical protein Bhyg_10471 [Pseudolycoriella hygida]